MKALLALEDGSIFTCQTFTNNEGEVNAEVCFNTSMTGYQEILTDPSYKGQMVCMTYPMIGNYGINSDDAESGKIHVTALLIKEYLNFPSNFRSKKTLKQYLSESGILGVEGLDTRALTRHLRTKGTMKGILSTIDLDPKSLIRKAKNSLNLMDINLIKEVTCLNPYRWINGRIDYELNLIDNFDLKKIWSKGQGRWKVAVLDYGIKYNILRHLESRNIKIIVLPATTTAKTILRLSPDGILLSNGPGDPAKRTIIIETVRELLGKKPIFGICLGHQMLALALGGRTYKLKFGHRGTNQPVINLMTEKIEITSQNHGFCVESDSFLDKNVTVTHINLNDRTLEGLSHKKIPFFCVQYHPEASPGPHDSNHLFDFFIAMMKTGEPIGTKI